MSIKSIVRRGAAGLGYNITNRSYLRWHELRRQKYLTECGVTLVLDVGADEGQYARQLRNLGYDKRIVSFEPLSKAYRVLQGRSSGDPLWQVRNEALGENDGEAKLHVAAFGQVSSILQATGTSGTDLWKATTAERILVRRLDSLLSELAGPDDVVYLKLDVQGFEQRVLAGADRAIHRISLIELEMSLEELYVGETLMPAMLCKMSQLGFCLASLQEVHVNIQSGRVLQYDGLFLRKIHCEPNGNTKCGAL